MPHLNKCFIVLRIICLKSAHYFVRLLRVVSKMIPTRTDFPYSYFRVKIASNCSLIKINRTLFFDSVKILSLFSELASLMQFILLNEVISLVFLNVRTGGSLFMTVNYLITFQGYGKILHFKSSELS